MSDGMRHLLTDTVAWRGTLFPARLTDHKSKAYIEADLLTRNIKQGDYIDLNGERRVVVSVMPDGDWTTVTLGWPEP